MCLHLALLRTQAAPAVLVPRWHVSFPWVEENAEHQGLPRLSTCVQALFLRGAMPSPLTAVSPQPALHCLWGKDGLGACSTWYCHFAAGGVVWNILDPWGCPRPGLVSPVGPANVASPGGTAAAS